MDCFSLIPMTQDPEGNTNSKSVIHLYGDVRPPSIAEMFEILHMFYITYILEVATSSSNCATVEEINKAECRAVMDK